MEVRMSLLVRERQCGLCLLLASVICGHAAADDCGRLEDTGSFRVGVELGEERWGFTGRLQFMIFTSTSDPRWPDIQACLNDPLLDPEMEHYVGVLVDELTDQTTLAGLRNQGIRGVGRSLSGPIVGLLPAGFTCLDLLRVLQNGRLGAFNEKSPVYSVLLDRPEAIVDVARTSGCASAAKFANFIEEFEGAESDVAIRVRESLESACFVFVRGDSNGDGTLDISDAVHTLSFLFLGEAALACEDMADSNDDGEVDISDALRTLGHLFECALPPPYPFPDPATDPTQDPFSCGDGEGS
jgi:hypothetical protein